MMDTCERCGGFYTNGRYTLSPHCNNCINELKEQEVNKKLNDIRCDYTLEQRIRAIERYIIQEKGTLKYE